jgi:hypothetical protein
MVAAIHAYLELLKDRPDDESVRLDRLAEALDRLVIAYHHTPDTEPEGEGAEAPSVPYEPLAKRAAASFPELGYYADVDPEEGLDQKIGLADAIDDLADIARDLTEVLWHLENVGVDDAIWVFRFGYRSHWGTHLHRLRLYLHAKMN